MAFLAIMGRDPSPAEARVFDAMTVTLVEHGMTPMAITARLTYLGAPESLQGAVAAGLLGMGSRFGGGSEAVFNMLRTALPSPEIPHDPVVLAKEVVTSHLGAKRPIAGLGHNLHKPVDPRTPKLFQIAEEEGLSGPYVTLLKAIADEAHLKTGKHLPINATGAIGALCCEIGLPLQASRGIAVMARAIGLVGHLIEEAREPMARSIWERAEAEINEHHFPGGKAKPRSAEQSTQ